MANEFQLSAPAYSGETLYALRRNLAAQIWDGAAFANYVTANYATYPITMTEQGTGSGYFVGTDPAPTVPGTVVVKVQAGEAPAETDADAGDGDVDTTLVRAAVYDTAARTGSVITLSNGATQTIGDAGRATT